MPTSVTRPSDHPPATCLPFTTPDLTLSRVGGKGLNLARLAVAGFPVPAGFTVTTEAYETFVNSAGLAGSIAAEVSSADTGDPAALTAISDNIRSRFQAASMPGELSVPIVAAYENMGRPPVAVRSSATAEDLPGMSFAGQQDTFLNLRGDEALLHAVVNCWSSLWTARAIAYRARNDIDNAAVSLAVVIQTMVESESSGVLFTANPLTGRRTETVIDATFGLGEALVSGQTEPDHYVVDSSSRRIIRKELRAKATVVRGLASGGLRTETENRLHEQSLTNAQVRQLTEMGQRVASLYRDPQDIEWAFAGGQLFILQSRPITSLFPLPPARNEDDLDVYLSLGAIQGVLGPFTPLGMDMLRALFAGFIRTFYHDATLTDQPLLHFAADRPWVRVTGALRNPLGRLIFRRALPMVEPGAAQVINELISGPHYKGSNLRLSSLTSILPFLARVIRKVAQALVGPESAAQRANSVTEAHVSAVIEKTRSARTLDERLNLCEWLGYHAVFSFLIPSLLPPVMTGYVSLALLNRMAAFLAKSNKDLPPHLALDLTRGLPNNVTTEMDLELWKVANLIREEPAAASAFIVADAETLAAAFKGGKLPGTVQNALEGFMDSYGMRGLAELDLGRPRWREQPLPVVRSLQSYLAITEDDMAPDRVFNQGRQDAERAVKRLATAASATWGTPFAGWLVKKLARRVRVLAGFRESPKFTLIRIFGIARDALLESGQELANDGVLERAEDLFYLSLRELKTLALEAPGDWKKLVRDRREAFRNEQRRQSIPRLLLSDGTAFYAGISPADGQDEKTLSGSGVSPGLVEGKVQVVLNPMEAALNPGDILVCPGTDPSWTPLFLAAGGLVMEVGGMMTHGSVVAREYGIPAVAGVDRATERLQTGQRVRVDGSSGTVEMID